MVLIGCVPQPSGLSGLQGLPQLLCNPRNQWFNVSVTITFVRLDQMKLRNVPEKGFGKGCLFST